METEAGWCKERGRPTRATIVLCLGLCGSSSLDSQSHSAQPHPSGLNTVRRTPICHSSNPQPLMWSQGQVVGPTSNTLHDLVVSPLVLLSRSATRVCRLFFQLPGLLLPQDPGIFLCPLPSKCFFCTPKAPLSTLNFLQWSLSCPLCHRAFPGHII